MLYSEKLRKERNVANKHMKTLISIIQKEFLHIVRDKQTALITLLMPLVLLLTFGFAISTEVNNVNVIAAVDRHTQSSRELIERISTNSYFTFMGLGTVDDIENAMKRGEADAGIVMKTDSKGKTEYQIIVDASNPNIGKTATAYLRNIISNQIGATITTKTLYNPQLKSSYNFVPGIMGMIFILVCAIMTSVSIVREQETGTMNLLLVSPVKPAMVIIGKLIPYFLLSCIILAIMLIISYGVLGLPFSASVINVIWLTMIYIAIGLSIGLLVSTIVNTQLSALIVSAVLFMMPVIFFSGMMFPIDNMPRPLQWFSCIIPARWYIEALKKLMIQQLGISSIMKEVLILSLSTVAVLAIAIKKFNSKK